MEATHNLPEQTPFELWTGAHLKEFMETPGRTPLEQLNILLYPKVAALVRRTYGEKLEEKVWALAKPLKPHDPLQELIMCRAGVWFLRQYSWWRTFQLYRKLLGLSPVLLISQLLLVRLLVSVWIGMLVICGTSPWPVLMALDVRAQVTLAAVTCGLTWLLRFLYASGRSDAPSWLVATRALLLTGWGWFWAAAVLIGFGNVCGLPLVANAVCDRLWFLLPSIGSAVGVMIQELWEDRPVSEPV